MAFSRGSFAPRRRVFCTKLQEWCVNCFIFERGARRISFSATTACVVSFDQRLPAHGRSAVSIDFNVAARARGLEKKARKPSISAHFDPFEGLPRQPCCPTCHPMKFLDEAKVYVRSGD